MLAEVDVEWCGVVADWRGGVGGTGSGDSAALPLCPACFVKRSHRHTARTSLILLFYIYTFDHCWGMLFFLGVSFLSLSFDIHIVST